ncbi:hypothetical protein GGR50DRAFT_58626 [Xylaria sp. CBS 124048]|nr:hypothetical protein GGR50DRAFT_58626 [Xylaria sp. CBS 124048]
MWEGAQKHGRRDIIERQKQNSVGANMILNANVAILEKSPRSPYQDQCAWLGAFPFSSLLLLLLLLLLLFFSLCPCSWIFFIEQRRPLAHELLYINPRNRKTIPCRLQIPLFLYDLTLLSLFLTLTH